MKRLHVYLLIALVSVVSLTWYTVHCWMRMVPHYTITFDDYFSPSAQTAITQVIENEALSALPLKNMHEQLNNQFRQIQNISFEQHGPGQKHLMIESTRPRALLYYGTHDTMQVMNEDGAIVDSTLFEPVTVKRLPHIGMHQELTPYEIKPCENFLNTLKPAVLKNYTITWNNESEIYLCNKEVPWLCFLCTSDQHVSRLLNMHAPRMKDVLTAQRVKSPRTRSGVYVVDLRFDNQLIVFVENKNKLPLVSEVSLSTELIPQGGIKKGAGEYGKKIS